MRQHVIAVIVFALAGVANADPPGLSPEVSPDLSMNVDGAPPDRVMSDQAVHFDLGVDSGFRNFTSGDMSGQTMFGLTYALRRGRYSLIWEGDFAALTARDGGKAIGSYGRLGFAARIAFVHDRTVMARAADGRPTDARLIDVWVEPGAGQSLATQEMGPALHQEDVSAGIGITVMRQHAAYAWGSYFAVKLIDAGLGDTGPRDVSLMVMTGMTIGH
jgi:hypothetical protein